MEALLLGLGAAALTVVSEDDEIILEPGPGELPAWQRCRLFTLFPLDANMGAIREALDARNGGLPEDISVDFVADEDWQRRLSNNTVTALFGDRLWLLPKTRRPEGPNPSPTTERPTLFLEPGLAFGSGSHPTTRLCLEWLARHIEPDQSVLDFGCGSGVLAIATALLGARAVGVDHDPQALIATRENAAFNGVDDRVKALSLQVWQNQSAATHAVSFDVLVANILAGPIVSMADMFTALVKPGGHLVLSGILAEQAAQVRDAFPSLSFLSTSIEQDWVCLVARK